MRISSNIFVKFVINNPFFVFFFQKIRTIELDGKTIKLQIVSNHRYLGAKNRVKLSELDANALNCFVMNATY